MSHPWVDDAKLLAYTSQSGSHPVSSQSSSHSNLKRSHKNIYRLLALREISPRAKQSAKPLWGQTSRWRSHCTGPACEITDARHALISWVEAESLRHLSAKYCPLLPPPRSTIAAAFSSDGQTLASTHGDHTVKIIDCQTGSCLKVLSGHRRTPWVVRFHPLYPEILASGSLDHEVRLWDAQTADCIGSRDFYRPIASIAFHAQGELLAVASGHKLYIWNYNRRGEASSPTIVLKTRRSLRAVHFHPHGAPFLLTAEVNDLDSPDSPVTLATSSGYLHYPPPAVFFANIHSSLCAHLEAKVPLIPSPYFFWPTFVKDEGRTAFQTGIRVGGSTSGQQRAESLPSNQQQMSSNMGSQLENLATPMDISPVESLVPDFPMGSAVTNSLQTGMGAAISDSIMESVESTDRQRCPTGNFRRSDVDHNAPSATFQGSDLTTRDPTRQPRPDAGLTSSNNMSTSGVTSDLQMLLRSVEGGQLHQFVPFNDPSWWEFPFLQGWFMAQSHAGISDTLPFIPPLLGNSSVVRGAGGAGRSSSRQRLRSRLISAADPGERAASLNAQNDESEAQPVSNNIESDISTSLAAAAAAELPCTVKLRIWPHDIQDPCAPLDAETCRLTIPHAVLCSEMGAHFSPCGRFLAACVACTLPHMENDPGLQSQIHHDPSGVATSPTRHPVSAHQVMYELRIYSLEEATFGSVLASRAIRAAHCLTSIQFSPTSEHILLAYGRRHSTLLRSIVIDGETAIPIYTILEVYRVSDMDLVRVLPSAEDEVNVACFHPLVGGGLVYGTKEGKLRILQYDGPHGTNCSDPNLLLEENMLEIQKYALEG